METITLTDAGCVGSAQATVHTVSSLEVSPSSAEVPPEGCLSIGVNHGSGEYVYEFTKNQSGGSLSDAGGYVAGDNEGIDVVRVSDLHTGEYVHVVVNVSQDAVVVANPTYVAMPQGGVLPLPFAGGSGHYDIQVSGDAVLVDGDSIRGERGLGNTDRNGRLCGLW